VERSFSNKYGPWALVTGSTSGIGEAFAHRLASLGLNLVLVARREEVLAAQAEQLRLEHDVDVRTVRADLSDPAAAAQIDARTRDIEVGLLIPNAGVEHHGFFTDNALERETRLLQLNALAPMQLAHRYGARMSERGRGGILFVSSTGAFGIGPYMAGYVASKSYILKLGETLHYELGDKGVDVTVVCPGATQTPMLDGVGVDVTEVGMKVMSPESVVDCAIEALGTRPLVIPGKMNRFAIWLTTRVLSRRRANDMNYKTVKKLFGLEGS